MFYADRFTGAGILTEEIQYIEEICPRIRQLLQKSFHIREE
jgi:hypothetical protein